VRNYIRGYILNMEKFWSYLREELCKWLPSGGVEIVLSKLKDRFGFFHYMLVVSDATRTFEEAVERIMSLATMEDANRIIIEGIKEGFEPIVYVNLKQRLMKEVKADECRG